METDEVFFTLAYRDAVFQQAVKTFAGARELALSTSGIDQQTYFGKAETAKDGIKKWLRNNADAFSVTHQGETRPLLQWERHGLGLGADAQFRDIVQGVAAGCLAPYFEDRYPRYPTFAALRQPITRLSRPKMVQDALRMIARQRTQSGMAILDGLELLDGRDHSPSEFALCSLCIGFTRTEAPWLGVESS